MANEGERGMLILEWLMGRAGYGNIRMANQGEQGIINQGLHVDLSTHTRGQTPTFKPNEKVI